MSLTTIESGSNSAASGKRDNGTAEGVISYSSSDLHDGVTGSGISSPRMVHNVEADDHAVPPRAPIPLTHKGRVTPHKPIGEANKRMLHEAFLRITESYGSEISRAERSNCFDDWKDSIRILARKEENLPMNHRKILGSVIAVTQQRDISDFGEESLKILHRSTYLLRQPRISRKDAKNVIAALLRKNFRISIPMAVDDLDKGEIRKLDEMMTTLVDMSKAKE